MRRAALVAGIPLAFVLLVVAGWRIDVRRDPDRPMRNITVAGRDARDIAGVVAEYAKTTVTVHTSKGDVRLAADDIGLAVDEDATAERAVDEGRHDALPFAWLRSLVGHREAGVVIHVDDEKLRRVVAAKDPTGRVEPTEPGIDGDDGQIAVVLGKDGHGIDAGAVRDAIVAAAADGHVPIDVDAARTTLHPRFSRADAEALSAQAQKLTSSPISVVAGDTSTTIPGSIVRSWITSKVDADGLDVALDDDEVLRDLARLVKAAGTEPQDARVTIDGGRPVIVPSVTGRACCAPQSVGYILGAVKAGTSSAVNLPLRTTEPEQTTEDVQALGIVEEIGSFTTHHKCCENRVTNIHRIADLIRGVVIAPGKAFSVNDFVGKRTLEKGFLVDHVIENGSFSESVGGGISQFATTFFNAAFFGGLELKEYQSHSIYISRYPYGREATLSFPKPDLKIGNPYDYGVLVWPTYTDTSLTVTLYSTRVARGEQTAQTMTPVGPNGCVRVKTERTRTYVSDGHTAKDAVFATYRPSEGVQCS